MFDFGDEWRFNVEFTEYDEEASLPLKLIIIESKGKSSKQY